MTQQPQNLEAHPPGKRGARIAIFVSFSGQGGVERMMVNLAHGLSELGCSVDLVTVKSKSAYIDLLPKRIRRIDLKASHTFTSVLPLMAYLRKTRPAALLAAKDRANIVAVIARALVHRKAKLVLRMGTTVSAALGPHKAIKKRLWYLRMKIFYPMADSVIAVSKGVARDLMENAGLSGKLVTVVENPVVSPHLWEMAAQRPQHPWFASGQPPVIVGVGRLTRQKDFPTLIRAFAKTRATIPCRLMILGDGRDREKLKFLAEELGVATDIHLAGFVKNPYPYIKHANLFVLSSAWEGSPNALTEALALGTPVVSTDCPNGPREILQDGKFGELVPIGDAEAMSRAMINTLSSPPEKSFLKSAIGRYTLESSCKRYMELLLDRN